MPLQTAQFSVNPVEYLFDIDAEPFHFTFHDEVQLVEVGVVGPSGAAGPEGAPGLSGGPGLNWRGAWISGASYLSNDVVSDNGSSWVALRTNIGVQPVVGLDWDYVAQKGALGGDANYVHDQITAVSSATVVHNLGKYPSVTVFDSAGDEVVGEIDFIDINSLIVTFTAPFSFKAVCN